MPCSAPVLLAFALAALPVRGEVLASLEGEQTALYEAVAPGVAVLTAGRTIGAGFAVAPGLLLTAAHVVEGVASVEVQLRDGRVVRGEVAERAAGGLDLALVRIPVDLPVLALAPSAGLRAGSVVATVGHPDGNRFTLGTGLVAQEVGDGPDPALVRLQLPLRQGASGGPVVDRAGRVVGVVALGAAGTVAFAVRTEAARGALRGLATVAVVASPRAAPAAPIAGALPLSAPASEGAGLLPAASREDGSPGVTPPELITAPPDQPAPRARVAGRAVGPIPRAAAPALVGPSPDLSPRFAWRGETDARRGETEGERPLLSLAPAQRGRGVGERGPDHSPRPARSAELWSLLLVGVGLGLGAGVLATRGIGRRRSR